MYTYVWKHPQPDVFRVNGALFDESVERLVRFVPFPQHANSSLTPLGRSRLCMIRTVNCEFCQTLGRRWCLPFFERRLLCVCFLARPPLLHVRVWTEASHQWLFTHCQGVVESRLHICSHLAPRSDKNNVLHREGLHAKLLYGITSVNTFRMRHYTCNTCWPSGSGAVFWGFTSSWNILSSLTSQFDDSG